MKRGMNMEVANAVKILNEAAKLDKSAIQTLVEHREYCNEGLANHPSIQVIKEYGQHFVGLLGIINGILGPSKENFGKIAAIFHVICSHCTYDGKEEDKAGDECSECGNKLITGGLIKFEATCVSGLREHNKVFNYGTVLTSNPPQFPWICADCGIGGADRQKIEHDDYYRIVHNYFNS